nr:hypothetical protein [Microbacterium lemovicicum]
MGKKPPAAQKPAAGKKPATASRPAGVQKPADAKTPGRAEKPAIAPQSPGTAPEAVVGSPKPVTDPQTPVTLNGADSNRPAPANEPASADKPASAKKPTAAKKPSGEKKPAGEKKTAPRPTAATAAASTDWRQPASLGRAPVSTPPPRPTSGLPAPRTTPPITKPAYVATSKTARAAAAAAPVAAPFPAQKAPEPSTTQRVGAWVRERALLVSLAPLAVLVVLLAGGLVLSLSTARPVDSAVAPPAAEAPAAEAPAAEAPAAEAPAGTALQDATMASVTTWLRDNLGTSATVLVDDDVAEQLFLAGIASARIVDASSAAAADADWRSIGYLVDTESLRAQLEPGVGAQQALDSSVPVAAFDGAEIRAVAPQGTVLAASDQQHASDVRLRVGRELLANPAVRMSDAERAVVASGRVDDRIVVILATMGSAADVRVSGFPLVDGETDGVIRTVAVRSLGGVALVSEGQPTADARALVDGFRGTFTPSLVAADGEDLILRYPVSIGTTIE